MTGVDLEAAARTDTGRVREHNEDAYVCEAGVGLFAVIDGMGGQAAGEVAAGIARETLLEAAGAGVELAEALRRANEAILDHAGREPRLRGMGCVATAARVRAGGLEVAHVGDTRAYLASERGVERLTRDHTVVAAARDAHGLTEEQARELPFQHQVTRDLGGVRQTDTSFVDRLRVPFAPGDLLLLCSDGLHDLVQDEELFGLLARARSAGRPVAGLADELIALALERGGRDNVTVVLVRRAFPSAPGRDAQEVEEPPEAERTLPVPDRSFVAVPPPSRADPAAGGGRPRGEAAPPGRRPRGRERLLAPLLLLLGVLLGVLAAPLLRPPPPPPSAGEPGPPAPPSAGESGLPAARGLAGAAAGGVGLVAAGSAGLDAVLAGELVVRAAGPLEGGEAQVTALAPGARVVLSGVEILLPEGATWRIEVGEGARLTLDRVSLEGAGASWELLFEGPGGEVLLRDGRLRIGRMTATGHHEGRVRVEGARLRLGPDGRGKPLVEGPAWEG